MKSRKSMQNSMKSRKTIEKSLKNAMEKGTWPIVPYGTVTGLIVPYGACHGVTCSVRCHLVRWQRLPPEQVAAAATWETARSRPGELGRAPARLEVDGPQDHRP